MIDDRIIQSILDREGRGVVLIGKGFIPTTEVFLSPGTPYRPYKSADEEEKEERVKEIIAFRKKKREGIREVIKDRYDYYKEYGEWSKVKVKSKFKKSKVEKI